MPAQTTIQVRRGTAASWTSTNPTLAAGEVGFETDTGKFKIGTGSAVWTSLTYFNPGTYTSPLTTKGDLFTYSTTDARLPVGSNGQTLVADSSQTTGLGWANNFAAGKNKIINGDFRFNQRNFTSNTASVTYNFDRWRQVNGGATGVLTVTPQTFTPGTAPVSGYEAQNFVQCVTTNGASTGTYAILGQPIEDVRTLAGQTATISFWAKAGSGTPKIAVELEQEFGTGGSPSANVTTYAGQVTLSTSWARYSVTVAVPSISGKTLGTNANSSDLLVSLWLSSGSDFNSRNGSLGLQNNTFQIWGVQVEAGSVATAFTTATGTIQGELAACQRYYWRTTSSSAYYRLGNGLGASTTVANLTIKLPQTMRVTPTTLDYSNPLITDGASNFTGGTLALQYANPDVLAFNYTHGSANLTQFRPYLYFTDGGQATSYIGASAEL